MACGFKFNRDRSSHGVSAGPIQINTSAPAKAAASEGRMWYPCGDAPGGSNWDGVATPAITFETRADTAGKSVATLGAAETDGAKRTAAASADILRNCFIMGRRYIM
jgi:hypothetical protein